MLDHWCIESLLETDLYKFNMDNLYFTQYSDYTAKWAYKCRKRKDGSIVQFTKEDVAEINRQLDHLCSLTLTREEIDAIMKEATWLTPAYRYFLSLLRLDRSQVRVSYVENDPSRMIIEAGGDFDPLMVNTFYEIYVLAIVNEVYFYNHNPNHAELEAEAMRRIDQKVDMIASGKYRLGAFSEFGLRRRFSRKVQDYLIRALATAQKSGVFGDSVFLGTSNVYLALKYGVKLIGTIAHEAIEAIGQGNPMYNPAYSNRLMMDAWQRQYKGCNGIYLTDCVRTDVFLKDLTRNDVRVWDGFRHDSGDPYVWGDKMIDAIKERGGDPLQKTLLFSDSLDFERATKLYDYFHERARVGFGIGTYLSNDCGLEPLNQVMKVIECNGRPVAKISDTEGKLMCRDAEYVARLKSELDWRLTHG
jgi:nicotinate phosphoribosyltransferase